MMRDCPFPLAMLLAQNADSRHEDSDEDKQHDSNHPHHQEYPGFRCVENCHLVISISKPCHKEKLPKLQKIYIKSRSSRVFQHNSRGIFLQ